MSTWESEMTPEEWMSITNSVIVVVQNEPRDGDIVYLEKDLDAFQRRIVELDLVEADVAAEVVELGQTYYWDDESATIIGYEVQLPYDILNICGECFKDGEEDAVHEAETHLVVNFVAEADCEFCHKAGDYDLTVCIQCNKAMRREHIDDDLCQDCA